MMPTNKYYSLLGEILARSGVQSGKKGDIRYLLNERLELMPGERNVAAYRDAGITWWDYCGRVLVNSYPTYFEKLPPLVERINREKRNSKNYVLFLGATDAESNQAPCLSLVQFQIDAGSLVLSASACQQTYTISTSCPDRSTCR